MPAQNLEKSAHALKTLNKMPPTIPANDSREQLMVPNGADTQADGPPSPSVGNSSLRQVTARQWISILILCFVNLINYMDRFTLAGILQMVQDHFKIDDSSAGLLQTSFILSYMIFAPLFGYLGDRYSRKWIMAFGVFLWCLTTLVGSFMDNFALFTVFRALVGVGEASYSTIAPTIISDLFVGDMRSKMLALFYFAIPVGSGLGYIVGSETAKLAGEWQYALRVTPALGLIATLLIIFVLKDPVRGESEGNKDLKTGTIKEDVMTLFKNRSFLLSTLGFTCVAFVAGALAWWGPKLLTLGVRVQENGNVDEDSVSFTFGVVAMAAGLLGVPLGSGLAQKFRANNAAVDAHICALGLLFSAPMVYMALLTASSSFTVCCLFIFLGMTSLNLTWSIVADILLYVVLPTRRSTAEGFQLLFSHALGDAGSPYLIGVVSTAFKSTLGGEKSADEDVDPWVQFNSLQYALFITCFVEVLGGLFFLVNSLYIVKDRDKVDRAIQAMRQSNQDNATTTELN